MYPAPPTGGLDDFFRKQKQDAINEQVRAQLQQMLGGQYAPEAMFQKQAYDTGDVNLQSARSNLTDAERRRGIEDQNNRGIQQAGRDIAGSQFDGLSPGIAIAANSGSPDLIRGAMAQLFGNEQPFNQNIAAGQDLKQNNPMRLELQKQLAQIVPRSQSQNEGFQSFENMKNRMFQGEQQRLNREANAGLAQPQVNPQLQAQFMQQLLSFIQPQTDAEGNPVRPPMLNAGQAEPLMGEVNNPNLGALIMQQVIQNALKQQSEASNMANMFFQKK